MTSTALLPGRNGDDTADLALHLHTVEKHHAGKPTKPTPASIEIPASSYYFENFLSKAEADEILCALTPETYGGKGEIDYQQWFHMPNKKGKCEPLRRIKIAMGRNVHQNLDRDANLDLAENGNGQNIHGHGNGNTDRNGMNVDADKKTAINLDVDGKTDVVEAASTTALKSTKIMPLYRFPVNDQQRYGIFPFSQSIEKVRAKLMQHRESLGLPPFDFNHSVVLFYKDGDDCIGFHKDKTLDLEDETPIVSVSLGNARTYVMRDDIFNPKEEAVVRLGHGDLFSLGAETNERYYHSIVKENAVVEEGSLVKEAVGAEGGEIAGKIQGDAEGESWFQAVGVRPRISITFRCVATFRCEETGNIIGKGAQYQTGNWPEALRGVHQLGDIEGAGARMG